MAMTEREFQDSVVEMARLFGWRAIHFGAAQTSKGWRTPVRYDGKGAPDLVLVHDMCVVFAEIKADKGKMSPDQESWKELLEEVEWHTSAAAVSVEPPVRYRLWRPRDGDEIARLLSFGRVQQWTP